VGSGVVQLAKAFGAVVIATAGSDEKVEFCRSSGADHAVNYRTGRLRGLRRRRVTNGHGVDIAFDSVGGQVTTDTFRTMAFNGRHLIVGIRGGHHAGGAAGQPAAEHLRNFDLVGICFAFVDDPRLTHSLGMNFLTGPTACGYGARSSR
jgi:NADPH2:quinone reductase